MAAVPPGGPGAGVVGGARGGRAGWAEVSGDESALGAGEEEEDGDEGAEEDYEMDAEEEAALERFIAAQRGGGRKAQQVSIADLIMEKIRESEEGRGGGEGGGGGGGGGEGDLGGGGSAWARRERQRQMWEAKLEGLGLEPKVIEVYTMVGKVLSTYRSGKVPKAFKILPHLANWEHLIVVTDPDNWSDQATFVATRVFASSLNAALAQRFFNLVLLPKVRRQISESRRVNVHLYNALKKSLYKPAAFYKGVLLPLCASCTCTVREAVVLASILRKCTIPLLHSAAAIMKLCEMEYNATNSFFLRVLLDKRYALPYRVVDSVLAHFMAFLDDERDMPLVWHQALLVFVQRYKNEILAEDKEALRHLMRAHTHHLVSDEIRRELNNSRSRGQTEAPGAARLPAVAAIMDIDPAAFAAGARDRHLAIAGSKHMF